MSGRPAGSGSGGAGAARGSGAADSAGAAAARGSGATSTPMLAESARLYGLDSPESFAPHQEALGRLVEPEEVADAIAWLAGAGGAAVTGATVPVDGGMTL